MTAPQEPTNPSELFTPFLPTTYAVPEEADRLHTFLIDKFCLIADVVNDKTIGSFTQNTENFNGNKYIYDTTQKVRNGYQTIARIPSFPNKTTLTLTTSSNPQFPLSNINSQFVVAQIWGTANKPYNPVTGTDGDYFSFMAQGDSRISFTMSQNKIIITTTVDMSAYSGFIFINYIRDGV